MKLRSRSFLFLLALVAVLSVGAARAEPLRLRILHVNDFHGFAEPHKPFGANEMLGGVSFLSARVETLRGERPTLLVAAGDMIQGNSWANLSGGASVVEWMNALGFDAMVVGNHEFDFGQETLARRIGEASFPVLGANVEGFRGLAPFFLKEVGGVRVAVVGVVTEDVPTTSHPRNTQGLRFHSPTDTVRKVLAELAGRADVFVVLSHLGYGVDRELAAAVPGIDVIVGGHSHTKVLQPERVGGTLVVQAWEHAKALGVVDLTVEGGKVVEATGRLEEIRPLAGGVASGVQTLVEREQARVDALLSEPVTEVPVDLDGRNVRRGETNLGDLVADSMREAAGADVALTNGGGIRASIGRGTVRAKDIYAALPFDNYIVAVRLRGSQLREALEHGVSGVERGEGRFPQVSGLRFTYSPSAPAGARVREVWIGAEPLDAARVYTVATNDFLAAGGDGYLAFGAAVRASPGFEVVGGALKGGAVVFSDPGRWIRDVVVDVLRRPDRVAQPTGGRILQAE